MNTYDICRAVAALGPLALSARDELQRVWVRIDREGVTVAATDGHVAAMVCSPYVDGELPPCDGWLPAFMASAFNGEVTVETPEDGSEFQDAASMCWANEWRGLLRAPVPDEKVTFARLMAVMPRSHRVPGPMPLVLSDAMLAALRIAGAMSVGALLWCPTGEETPIRVDASRSEYGDPTVKMWRLVLGIMPARGV